MRDKTTSLEYIRKGQNNYLENLIALCPDGIIAIDRSGLITLFNPAAESLTGLTANSVVGRMNIADLYPSLAVAREIKRNMYADSYGGPGRIEDYEVSFNMDGKREIPIRLSAVLIYENGKEVGSVGFFHDLSPWKKMEATLRQLSITDSLTGLYNQRYFYRCLNRELDRSLRYHRPLSIIAFDLDNFKQCNDLLGHLEGDAILQNVGTMLRENIRMSDLAFRYGGDEFFVLLPESVLISAHTTAVKIRKAFNQRWAEIPHDKNIPLKPVSLSMGVAQAYAGEKYESLVKRVDLAMYEAKRQGGDRVKKASESIVKP